MKLLSESHIQKDLIASFLRSQLKRLNKVLDHIENENEINDFVFENIKCAEKDLRWLRKFYFNN